MVYPRARVRLQRGERSLTPRQRQVLSLVADGHPTKQIARELGLSVPMVKKHIANLFRRYGVPNRAALVREAIARQELAVSISTALPPSAPPWSSVVSDGSGPGRGSHDAAA